MSDTVATPIPESAAIEASGPKPRSLSLNMGPQHPSTHGVLRLVLELDGETIVKCRPDIGYLHTGIEKEFEVKNYQQAVTLTDRIDYLAHAFEQPVLLPGGGEVAWHWRFRRWRNGCA